MSLEDVLSFIFEALLRIFKFILFALCSLIMFPAWFLTIMLHPSWIKLFHGNKDLRKLYKFNFEALTTFFRLLFFMLTGIIMFPAWMLIFHFNDIWLGLLKA